MNKSLLVTIAVIVVGAATIYGISPYFTESTIDEAIPTGAITQPKTAEIKSTSNDSMEKSEVKKDDSMTDKSMSEETMIEEKTMMEEEVMLKELTTDENMLEQVDSEMTESLMTYSGTFVGAGDGIHDAQGDAYTIPLEDGSTVLRLENFQSTNGPDLFVYLSTDDSASEFINLGELKANKGNQNYKIPHDVDLSKYSNVLIWCKSFSVLFGSAELAS